MPLDPELVEEVQSWIRKADSDLRVARLIIEQGETLLSHAAFNAQQAAKKSLKGFLTYHSQVFRKTHNLDELGAQCMDADPTLEPVVRRAAILTDYAWRFRYPGDPEEPTPEEAAAALELAERVFEAILVRLPEKVRPGKTNER